MGRMAEARKRAQRRGRSSGEGTGPSTSAAPTPAAQLSPPAEKPSAPEAKRRPPEGERRPAQAGAAPAQKAKDADDLVFPSEVDAAESSRPGRIALPASGLASEILTRADVAAVAPPIREGESDKPAEAEAVASTEAAARSHNISFFAAPQREERKAVEATEHLVTFLLASEEYGVDVRAVQEIIRVTEITQVPRAPGFMKGVINLRGRIIPVIDLKRKLGLGEVGTSRQARIVVVKLKDRLIGLLVDGASQVLRVPVSNIEEAPEEVVEVNARYVRGVAKLESRLVILLDLQAVLSLELGEGGHESAG
jgi:purine-binding chemotaxis protein CheW